MKPPRIFLVIGASGVGKSSVTRFLEKQSKYRVIDMDAEITRRYAESEQEVTDYFQSVGMEVFQEKAIEILEDLKKVGWDKHDGHDILLVDIGAGAVYGSKWEYFSEEFNTILLSAYPEYLWNTRTKPNEIHKNFNHFMTWQFNVPKMLHDTCGVVMDVSYLSVKEVAECLDNKIKNFIKG